MNLLNEHGVRCGMPTESGGGGRGEETPSAKQPGVQDCTDVFYSKHQFCVFIMYKQSQANRLDAGAASSS